MVRLDLVREKIRRLRELLALLSASLPDSPRELAAERDRLDLVSFRVYLSMQEAIDLASHLIGDEGWGPAPSLRDHFGILARRGVIEGDLAMSLADGVKVRNLIGHAYGTIDPVRLHGAARTLLPLLDRLAARVLAYAESRRD